MKETYSFDNVLASSNRSLRTLPHTRLLGPSGARLWADYVELKPGFVGAIDFIHKCNIPFVFSVDTDFALHLDMGHSVWKPSHLTKSYENNEIKFSENKFMTWDDCAVSVQTWENTSDLTKTISLSWPEDQLAFNNDTVSAVGTMHMPKHDFDVRVVLACDTLSLWEGMAVQPGEKVHVVIAAAFGIAGVDSDSELQSRVSGWINHPKSSGGDCTVLDKHRKEYGSWFSQVPTFRSSDPLIDKTWLYRWYILRRNLADPQYGNLQHLLFYEGRSHKMSKTPWAPEGWEFSKLIPLSSPMHLLESRWHHNVDYGSGLLQTVRSSQNEDGLFECLLVDDRLHSYANFTGWAVYQYYLIHRRADMVAHMLPALKKQVDGESVVYGNEHDNLLIEYNHKQTGKEYQPSYWYFHDFAEDPLDEATYTPLKRVDRTVYHYLNCKAVATLCSIVGDQDEERYVKQAEQIAGDIKDKMWDDEASFFFDMHHLDDRKARVKNIVGYYPFWAGISERQHRSSLNYLLDEQGFGTRSPLPSVSVDCPIYAPGGGWQGQFIKGRNGCVWNGPAWPYTNSIVLDGLAMESKKAHHEFDQLFAELFREYSWMHYSGRDLARPYLVEHYDSQTGEPISDEVDYNHSYYIDLVIRHIVGLDIQLDHIIIDPVDVGLDYYELDDVHAAGKVLRITFGRPGVINLPVKAGLRLFVDDIEVAHSETLKQIQYFL